MKDIIIALDAMGGDHGLAVVVPAALKVLEIYSHVQLILVGDQAKIEAYLKKANKQLLNRLQIQHCTQTVGMDELPSQALRYKKDSSMRVALNLVKTGKAQAAVSAGNTGALMATARFVLKTLPGVDRPAIMAHIPADNPNQFVRVLDLGANVDSAAEQLVQFAIMGSVVASAVSKMDKPRVALLNIGEEEIKGNEQVKQTAELLAENKAVNYVGFAEGSDIFKDVADVIVCDGFVGNVALKTVEGASKLISKIIKEAFTSSLLRKFMAVVAQPVLRAVIKKLDPARYNGASLLGLKGIVVKSHGGANVRGFITAVTHAISEVESDVINLTEKRIAALLEKNNDTVV